jgi:hypothetical protein
MTKTEIDGQIERLRTGGTLSENEVKALCDKVSFKLASSDRKDLSDPA